MPGNVIRRVAFSVGLFESKLPLKPAKDKIVLQAAPGHNNIFALEEHRTPRHQASEYLDQHRHQESQPTTAKTDRLWFQYIK